MLWTPEKSRLIENKGNSRRASKLSRPLLRAELISVAAAQVIQGLPGIISLAAMKDGGGREERRGNYAALPLTCSRTNGSSRVMILSC
jgi:hypothetical protein